VNDRDRILAEASEWILLGEERPMTPKEATDFRAWRDVDPRHDAMFKRLLRMWDKMGQLDPERLEPPVTEADNVVTLELDDRPRRRWLWPASAVAAAAAVFIAFFALPLLMAGGEEYTTQVAELRLVTLPDGSQVTLGPRSKLAVQFRDNVRRVELIGGEAFFDVTHDAARPFFVAAGSSLIRVVGTKFDVNRSADTVRVSVLEGIVRVAGPRGIHTKRASPVVQLTAGQRTEMPMVIPEVSEPPSVAQAVVMPMVEKAPAPGAWREGRLVYDDARLGDLIADMNRYYEPGIRVESDAIKGRRVTAGFKTSEIPAFMSGLSAIVPVKVVRQVDGAYIVRPTQE
jgi:transmembrane sensor